jgi:hypothetical protein
MWDYGPACWGGEGREGKGRTGRGRGERGEGYRENEQNKDLYVAIAFLCRLGLESDFDSLVILSGFSSPFGV